ncbi:molybdopterin-binding protein [Clostridium aestuarii]|uniref:Molybdopterin-binding protein n=1 Tax=Clostridium aestuarii TaxID=338193 RepID=A0ABT4CYT5_9CLOT|nr:molybdopterin-binding protein [Clostridium aestuarii]MCY6484125.1 molybdopterin-binding protein [Clostridium aestuarii]
MINKAAILPTGDEILNGIVIDTNSPAIMGIILEEFPQCEITRLKPCKDNEEEIINKLEKCICSNIDLIIFIGGSGGGHRYVKGLGKDYTHSALVKYLNEIKFKEIYGYNGHLWSKLIAGKKDKSIIVNVPGPYVEAVEAAKACMNYVKNVGDKIELEELVGKIAEAVLKQYPVYGKTI